MATHTGVYVSLSLDHLPLIHLQQQVCARFDLTARPELHITLGYLGEVEKEPLIALTRELAVLVREPLGTLGITGSGGAFADDRLTPNHIRPIGSDTKTAELSGRSRVLWWAVEATEALLRAHRVLREALARVRLSTRSLPAEFYPHVTIGSFSGPGAEDPRSWDVHGVPKLATLGRVDCPPTVSAERLHITRTDLHPQSLFTIAEYGRHSGVVVWLTGWPSSGKSTLARLLQKRLAAQGAESAILDSDEVRHSVFPWLGYSPEDRERSYTALIGLAALLASQGHIVLVPATAPQRAMRDAARRRCPRFIEVHIATSREECANRDPKGLYRDQKIEFEYEPPLNPEVTTPSASDEAGLVRILECVRALRSGAPPE
jgi:adenylylsulfate kinase